MNRLQQVKNGQTIRVEIPCSTSNLGPGFDCLGAALSLTQTLEATWDASLSEPKIVHEGPCRPDVPPEEDLVRTSLEIALDQLGKELPPLKIRVKSEIPPGGGLGASGAAIVGGLTLGYGLYQTSPEKQDIFEQAYQVEGHPDNAAPSTFGGVTLSYLRNDQPKAEIIGKQLPSTYLIMPDLILETDRARKILPRDVSLEDAVWNLSRTGLLVHALVEQKWELLQDAMQDRLHEAYRLELIPGGDRAMTVGMEAGAYGVWISGAGPALGCFVPDDNTDAPQKIASVLNEQGLSTKVEKLSLQKEGVKLMMSENSD